MHLDRKLQMICQHPPVRFDLMSTCLHHLKHAKYLWKTFIHFTRKF